MNQSEDEPLASLYTQHVPHAVRLAFLLTGDQSIAEDLAHDAFLRSMGRFHDLRNQASFNWYLRRALINVVNAHYRKMRRERSLIGRLWERPASVDDPATGLDLWDRIRKLPYRQRAAIVLRYYEDLTEAQTAEVLRCSVGTVKSLVSRGIDRLGQRLIEEEKHEG